MSNEQTALVTGATSGLGFEAAAQLAEDGYAKVTITGRTTERAEQARQKLIERTGKNVFETLVLDLNSTDSVNQAASALVERHERINALLLNARMVSGSKLVNTVHGIKITFASSLIGHHQLTMALLEGHVLAPAARIVIAGSEAARGDVPTFRSTAPDRLPVR